MGLFNTSTEQYDTLKSELDLLVTGESRKNLTIASNDLGDFYDRIDEVDNSLGPLKQTSWFIIFVNGMVVVILGLTAFCCSKKQYD